MSEQSSGLIQLGVARPLREPAISSGVPSAEERATLERRVRLLAWGGIVWHFVECVIAAVAVKEGRESWREEGCADGCC